MNNLAALLLPLIPSLIQTVMQMIQAIESHADTPPAVKAQLTDIAKRLKDAADRVARVEV